LRKLRYLSWRSRND